MPRVIDSRSPAVSPSVVAQIFMIQNANVTWATLFVSFASATRSRGELGIDTAIRRVTVSTIRDMACAKLKRTSEVDSAERVPGAVPEVVGVDEVRLVRFAGLARAFHRRVRGRVVAVDDDGALQRRDRRLLALVLRDVFEQVGLAADRVVLRRDRGVAVVEQAVEERGVAAVPG